MGETGARLGRFFALMGMLFVISVGVVAATRLSHDALAMLIGLALGAVLLLPLTAFLLLLWRRQERRLSAQMEMQATARTASPPVIVVAPPMYGAPHQPTRALQQEALSAWEQAPRSQRAFTFVGED